MHEIVTFVVEHSHYAPGILFILILLAGLNLPISIDVLMVLSAFLAATKVPHLTPYLFICFLVGAYFSAWICYWMGRTVGVKLLKFRYFAKLLPQHRLDKMGTFYEKHGLLALIVGRFIPFGFRNCLFTTTGMSKANFLKFMWRDAIACTLWASTVFFTFHRLGKNYEVLLAKAKMLNLFIFLAFGVTVITIVCYKKYKKKRVKVE